MTLKAMEKVAVDLGTRSYDILLGAGWLEQLDAALVDRNLVLPGAGAMVFTSPRVGEYYFAPLAGALQRAGLARVVRHDIPDGERHKNQDEYNRCVQALAEGFPDPRYQPLIFCLGGGVVGDIGGYVAGTYYRGSPFVQIPTTLLAQVDSSVGGKTGIDFRNFKNILGVVHQPKLVYVDLATLNTLADRELRSGMAEVIKYGAVNDAELFDYLEANLDALLKRDLDALQRVVARCCAIKADVVRRDETESADIRIALNLGHTLGHAIEAASDFQLTHGECVAIGMVGACRMAVELGHSNDAYRERLEELLQRAGLPRKAPLRVEPGRIVEIMKHDKKAKRGKLRFILPGTAPGTWSVQDVTDEDLLARMAKSCLSKQ